MTRTLLRAALALTVASSAAVLGACGDDPTVPEAIQRLAGGEEWAALSAPAGLPRLDTWMQYMSRSGAANREAYEMVRDLVRDGRQARREGRLQAAVELNREAERIAVLSLARTPDARLLQQALLATDAWADRVRNGFELDLHPRLGETVEAVLQKRALAAEQLESGDTSSAVLAVAEISEMIRSHAPEEVALRVLARTEDRIDTDALEPEAAERALHLLVSARQELISGDARRALHRALYALQIVEGNELRMVRSERLSICPDETC